MDMDQNKNIPITDRTAFLEAELKRFETDLAQKNREIEVEKALEEVRAKALDMRSSAELSETSTILFRQLKELKIDAIRSGLGIFDDENNAIELWVTSVSADGKLFFILDYINIHVHPVFENIIESRKGQEPFAITKLEGKALLQYYRMISTYVRVPGRGENLSAEYYYSFFFSAGAINVVTSKSLTDEETDIMLRMANVFGLMYTRFLDLKRSEEQAILINEEKKILELTLDDLKATQAQLIQSEKMASLGELTAGIAHEIQNPLNFVNNFSEINIELIDEMKHELATGNEKQAISLADDIKENEQKILHHGKRADVIVKGMLQHSRTSTGKKEPADINTLIDAYMHLAYHGIRAKDKTSNVILQTDFDTSIGKIDVVTQDIGRVLLNLFNNAFYAVSEKQKDASNITGNSYEPKIYTSTRKIKDKIEIHIKDNCNGIPRKILAKIFQPFFTTKPSGQGTGLGLSLSYDIIKAHSGEIKVETKEGEGSEFIIQLPNN